jgi:hypothetical protein
MATWHDGGGHVAAAAAACHTMVQLRGGQQQLRTFHVRMYEPHVLGKPTGLAANGTYHELYVFFVLSNLTS